jgi:predicted transglutaminase-like cysteine proteinase
MQSHSRHAVAGLAAAIMLAALAGPAAGQAGQASERPMFIALGASSRPPIGWIEFCAENGRECDTKPMEARDVVLTPTAWNDLVRINRWVNTKIKPLTDMEHWGVVERWSYPDDGYGDCEDYVLLKRRMLMQAGWPRQALLITVVRDSRGDGHAVLTVKTDKGEFILDNQNEEILLWSETSYRFVKRQSQSDPNVWISLGDPRPAASTATSR